MREVAGSDVHMAMFSVVSHNSAACPGMQDEKFCAKKIRAAMHSGTVPDPADLENFFT
jgi:hypothetical protein